METEQEWKFIKNAIQNREGSEYMVNGLLVWR